MQTHRWPPFFFRPHQIPSVKFLAHFSASRSNLKAIPPRTTPPTIRQMEYLLTQTRTVLSQPKMKNCIRGPTTAQAQRINFIILKFSSYCFRVFVFCFWCLFPTSFASKHQK